MGIDYGKAGDRCLILVYGVAIAGVEEAVARRVD